MNIGTTVDHLVSLSLRAGLWDMVVIHQIFKLGW